MKKRWLLGCLAGAMAVSLCACGGSAVSEGGADGGSASVKEESNVASSDNSKLEDLGLEYHDGVGSCYISSGVYLQYAVPYDVVANYAMCDFDSISGSYIVLPEEECDSEYASVMCAFDSIGMGMYTNNYKATLAATYGLSGLPSIYDETNKTVEESSGYTNKNGLDAVVEKGHIQWSTDINDYCLYYTDCYIDYGQDEDYYLIFIDLTEDESKADFIDEVMAATVDSFVVEDTN